MSRRAECPDKWTSDERWRESKSLVAGIPLREPGAILPSWHSRRCWWRPLPFEWRVVARSAVDWWADSLRDRRHFRRAETRSLTWEGVSWDYQVVVGCWRSRVGFPERLEADLWVGRLLVRRGSRVRRLEAAVDSE